MRLTLEIILVSLLLILVYAFMQGRDERMKAQEADKSNWRVCEIVQDNVIHTFSCKWVRERVARYEPD